MKTNNLILFADLYKYVHWRQIPKNVTYTHAYVEARGSVFDFIDYTRPFGILAFVKEYLEGVVIEQWMIDEAKEVLGEVFGTHEYFNERGFAEIIRQHNGKLPVTIKCVEEGKKVGLKNVLVTIEAHGDFAWLVPWLETMILRATWYGTSVCTISSAVKDIEKKYAEICGAPLNPFFLCDFGARGVSSHESAGIGGCAHLVNYLGTDTVEGIMWGRRYYGKGVTGYSVYATEHSTTTIWGKENEKKAYSHFLQDAPEDKIVSIVTDSYNHENAVRNILGKELKDMVLAGSAPVVIRPDSGDPIETSLNTVQWLWEEFDGTVNEKGFKVLNPKVKVLYGDGINLFSIDKILENLINHGFSSECIFFGMGGKLLQGVDRDTFKFACKLSYAVIDGVGVKVQKDPITDPGKKSKAGILKLIKDSDGVYFTVEHDDYKLFKDELEIIFQNGEVKKELTFEQIRANAND